MTICIGVIDDAGCTLATDSLGISGRVKRHGVQKIYSYLGVSFVISGDLSGRTILLKALQDEMERSDSKSVSLTNLSNLLRKAMSEREWHPDSDRGGSHPFWDVAFLLTDGSSLVLVATDLAAEFLDWPMDTIGVGNEMAEGVYHYAVSNGKDVHSAAWDAVSTTAMHASACGGDVQVKFLPRDKAILVA